MLASKYKYFLASFILVMTFLFGLLKGPVVPDEIQSKNCARNVKLPLNLGLTLNCDSGIYLRLASNLNLLFEDTRIVNGRSLTPGNVEQSTPGSSIIVWIISKPIIEIWKNFQFYTENTVKNVKYSLNTVYSQLNLEQTVDDSFNDFSNLIPVYIAYILFNSLILIFCILLYLRTLKIKFIDIKPAYAVCFLISTIIIINDVNKQFFYSPGPQIFRILCPVLTVFITSKILKSSNLTKDLFIGSFIFGLMMLFYYIFFVSFLTLIFTYFLLELRKDTNIFDLKKIKNNFVCIILFILPSLLWFLICYKINDSVLIADMSHDGFGLFILVNQYIAHGIFGSFIFFLDSIVRTFYHSLIHSWFIVILMVIVFFHVRKIMNSYQRDLFKVCFFFFLSAILFFSFYSPSTSRMVFSSFLVFIPFIGEISKLSFNISKFKSLIFPVYFIFFSFYTIHTIVKKEPYGWYDEKGSYYFVR